MLLDMEPQKTGGIDLASATIDDLKSRDMTPAMAARAAAPKPTWFFERTGDRLSGKKPFVFACEEREAWDILNNKSEWKRRDFMCVGHSDGKTYAKMIADAKTGAARLTPQIDASRIEIDKYRAAEEKLIISEAVDMDGDAEDTTNEENKKKVKRLRNIIDKLSDKLEKLEVEYRSYTSGVVRTATEAELKVAMKNWKIRKTWPGAVNIYTPDASPQERARILKSMPQAN